MPKTPLTTMQTEASLSTCLPAVNDDAEYKRALRAYVERREPVGPFLRAVLENNLRGAIANASPAELVTLHKVTAFILWRLPAVSHGSRKAVAAWLNGAYPHVRALDD